MSTSRLSLQPFYVFCRSAAAVFLLASAPAMFSQQASLPVRGALDRDVAPIVSSRHPLGQNDQGALQELAAYRAALSLGTWKGIKAEGMMTFADSAESAPVTLQMLPGNRVRIDVTEGERHSGWLFNGWRGAVLEGDTKHLSLSARSNAMAFAPFELPATVLDLKTKASFLDEGVETVGGQSLHKVRIELPVPPDRMRLANDPVDRATLDAYFDPATHLLAKTASWVAIPGTDRVVLFRVTTYTGYRKFGEAMLPTVMSETINGQAMWSLTLTSMDMTVPPSAETFKF